MAGKSFAVTVALVTAKGGVTGGGGVNWVETGVGTGVEPGPPPLRIEPPPGETPWPLPLTSADWPTAPGEPALAPGGPLNVPEPADEGEVEGEGAGEGEGDPPGCERDSPATPDARPPEVSGPDRVR
jgi:hypothetical protein